MGIYQCLGVPLIDFDQRTACEAPIGWSKYTTFEAGDTEYRCATMLLLDGLRLLKIDICVCAILFMLQQQKQVCKTGKRAR